MRFGFSLVCASIPLLAVLSFPRPATPQSRANYLPDKIAVWRRWEISCSGSGYGLSKEQTRVYADKLQKMSEVIHHAKVFSPPSELSYRRRAAWTLGNSLTITLTTARGLYRDI